jgi:hypothetical protein
MITGSRKFGVFDKIAGQFLDGDFFITRDGKLRKEIIVIDPKFPNIRNTYVQDVDDDSVEIKWF